MAGFGIIGVEPSGSQVPLTVESRGKQKNARKSLA